ncbi:hypothetical protein TcasGA2_TC009276 [Tribolium castaneum]|uniref:Uncharacterized protein n=1 Tax=Tribolium castaneum TaxID=7070 RepID=D6WSA8_TRICA|nr:hypothetical protein TcasGA2_TC009276 [Tribolium castaneum]
MSHRSAASSDGLVAPPGAAAKCNIIHASLGGGTRPEGLQNNVDNSLGRLNVAADNRSVVAGVENRALRDVDLHGGEAALHTKIYHNLLDMDKYLRQLSK